MLGVSGDGTSGVDVVPRPLTCSKPQNTVVYTVKLKCRLSLLCNKYPTTI